MKNNNLIYKRKGNNMKGLRKKFINWILKDDNSIEDYNRNFCKYSKGYRKVIDKSRD